MQKLTQELVQKLINYDPITGTLSWKERGEEMFPNKGTMASWNARCAGMEISFVGGSGYIETSILDVGALGHRLAFLHYHGYLPEMIDHKNRVRTDNRICNLRPSSKSTNSCNSKIRSDNKTGVKGVGMHKQSGKYRARITINRIKYNLGLFDTVDEARIIIEEKRKELHGEFASEGNSKCLINNQHNK